MIPLLALLAVVGGLGVIGYLAWILSRDAAGPKPKVEPPYERALGALLNGDRDEAVRALVEAVRRFDPRGSFGAMHLAWPHSDLTA